MQPVSLHPEIVQVLAEHVERATREELREGLLLAAPLAPGDLPPPNAYEDERAITGLLLAGDVLPAELAPLTAVEIYAPLHAAVFVVAQVLAGTDVGLSIARVVAGLRAQGFGGSSDRIAAALEELRDTAPATVDLRSAVARIVDAARRRSLSRALRDADRDLRVGEHSAGEVASRLLEVLRA